MYRYIGNKTSVIEPLLEIITDGAVQGETFADLMCGTGSVSAALGAANFNVVAADILTFPTFHASVRLTMNDAPSFSTISGGYLGALDALNGLAGEPGYFWNEYSPDGSPEDASKPRKYLSAENAKKLDSISDQIHSWLTEGRITRQENVLLRHDLILAVNRIANIAGTYGHYRSTFSKSSLVELSLRPTTFNSWAGSQNIVRQGAAENLSHSIEADYLYLDPPYKKRQYAANYHLLETIALGDKPDPVGESGLRNWWPSYSDFCSKRKIEGAFQAVLGNTNFKKIFVSYSEDGLIGEAEMTRILSDFGSVKLHKFRHQRFRSNSSELAQHLDEHVYEVRSR